MIYDFKIHSLDRNASIMGQIEADDIAQATHTALEVYNDKYPGLEVVHITVEDTITMPVRRKEWENEA